VNPALEWLAEMDDAEFREVFRGSPVRRAKRQGLRRNAALAMGNSGEDRFLPALRKMEGDEDTVVAEAAKWATAKIRSVIATGGN
jgi:epoxyqueuosine reductase